MLFKTARILAATAVAACSLWAEEVTGASLDKAWTKAVLARDTVALERMYGANLIYAHATGVVDTKTEYLAKIRSGKQVYKSIDQQKLTENSYGTTRITHSWVRVTGTNQSGPFDDKVMMLHVWIKFGTEWQLAAHQTTKVP